MIGVTLYVVMITTGMEGVRIHGGAAVDIASCEARDERGHGHFDVEFDDVGNGMELDENGLVGQRHQANEHDLYTARSVSTSSKCVGRDQGDIHPLRLRRPSGEH